MWLGTTGTHHENEGPDVSHPNQDVHVPRLATNVAAFDQRIVKLRLTLRLAAAVAVAETLGLGTV